MTNEIGKEELCGMGAGIDSPPKEIETPAESKEVDE